MGELEVADLFREGRWQLGATLWNGLVELHKLGVDDLVHPW